VLDLVQPVGTARRFVREEGARGTIKPAGRRLSRAKGERINMDDAECRRPGQVEIREVLKAKGYLK
jgi:hypothetical protein